jgi:hypothetical protein
LPGERLLSWENSAVWIYFKNNFCQVSDYFPGKILQVEFILRTIFASEWLLSWENSAVWIYFMNNFCQWAITFLGKFCSLNLFLYLTSRHASRSSSTTRIFLKGRKIFEYFCFYLPMHIENCRLCRLISECSWIIIWISMLTWNGIYYRSRVFDFSDINEGFQLITRKGKKNLYCVLQ